MSCELKEESNFSKKFNVPFFTMYQLYTDYSGENWMNVKYAEIGGTKIHYIKQNTPPKNEIINSYGKQNLSFDTIFMPHYWNKTGLVPGNKKGNLQIYIKNNGSFVNLSNEETQNQTDETMQQYNDTKSYIVHDDLLLSDSHKIPELLMNKILSHTRLFLSFKWIDDDDTFYGIYDFVDSKWKIENSEYTHEMLTNVKLLSEDKKEICKAMTEFMNYIKKNQTSSDKKSAIVAIKEGGGGSLAKSSSVSTIQDTKPQVSSFKKGKMGTIKTSQSVSNLHAGTSHTIFAVGNGGGASYVTDQNIVKLIKTQIFKEQEKYGESISKEGITTTDLYEVTKCYHWNDSNNETNIATNEKIKNTHQDAISKFNERRKILFDSDFFIVVAPHPSIGIPCIYVFSKDPNNENYTKIQILNTKSVELTTMDNVKIDKKKMLGDESITIDGYSILQIFCRHYGDDPSDYIDTTELKDMYLPQYKNKQISTNSPNWVDLLVNFVPELFDKIAFIEPKMIDFITGHHRSITEKNAIGYNPDDLKKFKTLHTDLIAAKPNFFIEYTLNISIFWTAMINDIFSGGTSVYVYDDDNNIKKQINIGKIINNRVKGLLFEVSNSQLKYSTLYYCENQIEYAFCDDTFFDKRPLPEFLEKTAIKTAMPCYELKIIDNLYLKIKKIHDVQQLGETKMVATFESSTGDQSNDFISNVKNNKINLFDLEQKVNDWFIKTKKDIYFKIYIDDSWSDDSVSHGVAPKLIFYSYKYLQELATVSGKTTDQLLKLCATTQNTGNIDHDLVIIAFNNGGKITTEEGKNLFKRYITQNAYYKNKISPIKISDTLSSTSSASSNASSNLNPGSNPSSTPDPTASSTSSSTSNSTSNLNPVSTSNQPSGNLSGSISGSTSSSTINKSPVSTSTTPVKTPAELFIKVEFNGTIPTKVEIVSANTAIPAGASALDLQDYINYNLFDNTLTSAKHEKYFKLTDEDQDLMNKMITQT